MMTNVVGCIRVSGQTLFEFHRAYVFIHCDLSDKVFIFRTVLNF